MDSVLDAESPQLAVLNGDLITGENTMLANATTYIDTIIAPFAARAIPWASTYGNHDSAVNLSRTALLAREQRHAGCLTKNMVSSRTAGVANYYIPVFPTAHRAHDIDDVPAALLWFFDSRGGNYFGEADDQGAPIPQPNWVDASVVAWFSETKAALARRWGRHVPSLVFVHIPIAAMLAYQDAGVDGHRAPGINDDVPVAQQGQGWGSGDFPSDDPDAYAGQDIPFMSELLDTPDLHAVFSGHDHGNDWCGRWKGKLPGLGLLGTGVILCFGRRSGYGGYGHWTRGARQVRLTLPRSPNSQMQIETWIRLEDGRVSGRVMLNESYGTDKYSLVDNTCS